MADTQGRTRQFFLNGAVLTAAALAMRTVAVSFNAYVTGQVGAEGMGLFSLVMSVYMLAVTFATSGVQLGTVTLLSGAIGREDGQGAERALRAAFTYALLFGGTAAIALFFLAEPLGQGILGDNRAVVSLRALSVGLLPAAVTGVTTGWFTAVRRVTRTAVVQVLEQMARILFVASSLYYSADVGVEQACLVLALGGALAECLSGLILYLWYRLDRHKHGFEIPSEEGTPQRTNAFRHRGFDGGYFMRLCKITLPVAISAYARSALGTAEHVLIPHCLTIGGATREEALAAFGILSGMALPIILYPMALLSSYAGLLVPEFAERMAKGDREGMRRLAGKALSTTSLYAFGVTAVLYTVGRELGVWIYGSEQAADFILLLAPVIPLMYMDHVTDAMLKGIGEQVFSMGINIADSLISILLVGLLLPNRGAEGYVYVIILTEIFNFVFSFLRLYKRLRFQLSFKNTVVLPLGFAAASVAVGMGMPVSPSLISFLLRGAACIGTYFLLMGLFYQKKKQKAVYPLTIGAK